MPNKIRDDFLIFGSPAIGEDEISEVVATIRSGWLGTGPKVKRFEEKFSSYKAAPNVLAVNSCTAALHLSCILSGISPGDEVITTPLTFCATVNSIIHAGGVPVLADINPGTLNIDPLEIQKKVTLKTKAIIPVHFAGRPCEMDEILDISKKYNLVTIEDCAHAIESEYKGQKIGTLGDFGCFSFYTTKNITTGEGGALLARKKDDIERARMLSLHGMSGDAWNRFGSSGFKHYQVMEAGFKYNMMDIQASIGIHQLDKLEKYWARRKAIWARYKEELYSLPILLPPEPLNNTRHGYHLFTIQVSEQICNLPRQKFIDLMTLNKIGVGIHYLSVPEHPFYQSKFGWKSSDYPVAESVGRSIVSIPLSAKLSDEDVGQVIDAIKYSLQVG